MANSVAGSVWFIDTTAALPQIKDVVGIKVIGNGSGGVTIKGGGSSSGNPIYAESRNQTTYEPVCFRDADGIHVTVAAAASCYIYTRVEL
jgi:hypothetical protein